MESCNQVTGMGVELPPAQEAKCLFRRASAHLALDDFASAQRDAEMASLLAPRDAAIQKLLRSVLAREKAHRKREQKNWKHAFD